MVTRVWEVRYKLNKQGKYFFKKVTATYQHEANQLFDVDLPNAIRCGSARPVKQQIGNELPYYSVTDNYFLQNVMNYRGNQGWELAT